MSAHLASNPKPILAFHLLGTPQIMLDGRLLDIKAARSKALLIYLAVTGQPQPRPLLARLLWDEVPDPLSNLRSEIRRLKQAAPDCIDTEHNELVSLNLESCWIDLSEFETLTADIKDITKSKGIEEAVALYRDEFLSDFDLPDAPEFAAWVLEIRKRCRPLIIEALRTLAYLQSVNEDLGRAIGNGWRLLGMDEFSDPAYGLLMELLARNGQVEEAQDLYKTCRSKLEEMGIEPSETTEDIYKAILNHQFAPLTDVIVPPPLPVEDIPEPSRLPIGSVMPLSRNPLFVGREADLQALAETLSGSTSAAVGITGTAAATGLGGIGKTQLACEFVHRYGRFFSGGVFWMSFDNAAAVPYEVAACGRSSALDLGPNFEEQSVNEQVQRVIEAWQSAEPRLLVFDNCEDPALLAEWRPTTGGCRVLITSRRGVWERALDVSMVALGILSREESVALLQQHCPDADLTILDAIAAEVGDLPLALHLAGSYLDSSRFTTPETYLAELRDPALLDHPSFQGDGYSPTGHDQNVGRTFALSYDQLNLNKPDDQLAHTLLVHTANFAPGEPIWNDLLVRTLPLDLDEIPRDADRASRAFDRLIELGIIKNEDNTLRMHRLVAAFVCKVAQDDVEAGQRAVETAVIDEIARVNADVNPRELQAWQTHLRFVIDVDSVRGDEQGADLCTALGRHLWQTGDFDGALPYHEKALAIREKILGPDDPAVAESLVNIGRVLRGMGKSAETQSLFERSLEIRMARFGEQHVDTAESLENLGRCLHELGDPAAGLPYIEKALSIVVDTLGQDNELVPEYHNNIAYCYYELARYSDALGHLEKALEINTRIWGTDHPHTALSHNNLGTVLRRSGQFDLAQAHLEHSLQIRHAVYGENHHEVASSLYALSELHFDLKQFSAALRFAEDALRGYRTSLGESHARTSYGHMSVGKVLALCSNTESAREHLMQALAIRENIFGQTHYLTEECRTELLKLSESK